MSDSDQEKRTKNGNKKSRGKSDPGTFSRHREIKRRWLLASPSLLIIGLIGILPLSIILVYSFMTPGRFAGVEWKFTLEAWINLFLMRDIFDGTLGINYAHLSIFARSVGLAFTATVLTLLFGFPTAYFIAIQPAEKKNF